jgi:cob(I)alamin adenosyltransferase
MKIYTKTGDQGETGLVGGSRIAKTSARIKAIGDVDELNASIGLARCQEQPEDLERILAWLQSALFDLGAELASLPGARISFAPLPEDATLILEQSIDEQTAQLPPLKNFILPGGSKLAAQLHMARCICRRAERSALALSEEQALRAEVLAFLNRLSDWLFVAARTANSVDRIDDVPWKADRTSG